jgi:hypothetical protein
MQNYFKEVGMWIQTYSKIFPGLKREEVWRLWADVDHWTAWHAGLDSCKLYGPFAVGSYFMLKPKGMGGVRIDLIEMSEQNSFTDCTTFFGAKMYYEHSVEETPEGLLIRNKLWVTGPLKYLWIKLVARKVADSIPEKIEALASLAGRADD